MLVVQTAGDIAASSETLWNLVRDFGAVSWMQGVSKTEIVGEGIGMTRLIYAAGDGPPVHEQLESLDDEKRTLGYTIPKGIPFPIKNYHSVMTVTDIGDGKSHLDWRGSFEADGVPDEQALTIMQGMYPVLLDWVKTAAEQA